MEKYIIKNFESSGIFTSTSKLKNTIKGFFNKNNKKEYTFILNKNDIKL